jgi:hypothetical protein
LYHHIAAFFSLCVFGAQILFTDDGDFQSWCIANCLRFGDPYGKRHGNQGFFWEMLRLLDVGGIGRQLKNRLEDQVSLTLNASRLSMTANAVKLPGGLTSGSFT